MSETDLAFVGGAAWLRTEEYGELKIPLERLLKSGRLDVYPDVLKSGLFKIYFKGDELVFQAGGWIGMLHINPNVVIEVTPRVPINNLEHIIARSRSDRIMAREAFSKGFASSSQSIPSIIDIFARRLVEAVDALQLDGLHYEYEVRRYSSSFPHGRIDPAKSALHRLRMGRSSQSVYEAWERSFDVLPNRYIRSAVRKLIQTFEATPNKSGRRKHIAALRKADAVLDHARPLLDHAAVDVPRMMHSVSAARPRFGNALGVSQLILEEIGIELRSAVGGINLNPILVLMEDAFEGYVRNLLDRLPYPLIARDGNLSPPEGAKKLLVDHEIDTFKVPVVTPDLVIYNKTSGVPVVVADVKYKIVKEYPSSDDRNQVLVYALSYKCDVACLVYPRRSRQSRAGLTLLGAVGTVTLYAYFFDLNSADLEAEERLFVDAASHICADLSLSA